MKIAFFGTGEFSKNIFEGLNKNKEIEVKLLVSQPDKFVGRKKVLKETEVKLFAKQNNIEIHQPKSIRLDLELIKKLKYLNLDFIIVVAYGQIISKEILDIPKYLCINLHTSILPKYRGASPIQEAIKNGDKKTGITLMQINEEMDKGDMINIQEIDIDKEDKTKDIFLKIEKIGAKFLFKTLQNIINGTVKLIKQDESKSSYCSKIKKENGEIDFKKEKARDVYNKYRAYSIWPGIYTYYKGKKLNLEDICYSDIGEYETIFSDKLEAGKVIKINKKTIGIVCFDLKFIILNRVKLEGKKTMDILSFINGNKDFLDYIF